MDHNAAHNAGIVAYRNGQTSAAIKLLTASFAQGVAASGKALFAIALRHDEAQLAFHTARSYYRQYPLDFAFAQHFVNELSAFAQQQEQRYLRLAGTPPLAPTSFIICSHRATYFAAVLANIEQVMHGQAFEVIRIADAKSMNEGYARGVARAHFDNVVLCHDDIEIFIPDFAARLSFALAQADFVGIAGATRMSGPAMLFDGHPHMAGRVFYPGKTPAQYGRIALGSLSQLHYPAQVLDGVFIATRKAHLQQLGFDQTFDNFHYYDVDLIHRAKGLGMRVCIATDLGIEHRSAGTFSAAWQVANDQFANKFPELNGVPGEARHWYESTLNNAAHRLSLQQMLNQVMGC